MALVHMQRAGHKVLALIGGNTALTGDPSGKSEERPRLNKDELLHNVESVKVQLDCMLKEATNPAALLNNDDWISPISATDWELDVNRYFTVSYMLAKESVKSRLEGAGLNFMELSYMTKQAYDFWHLFKTRNCTLQCGGSDQWGNITAGIDFTHKKEGGKKVKVMGMTFPLLTTTSGIKFGKSAGNAIWLDPARTTPWALYQYLVRQGDADVVKLLKLLTFLEMEDIAVLEEKVKAEPEKRQAQKVLAYEVTGFIHGKIAADEVARAVEIIYKEEIRDLSDELLRAVFSNVPSSQVSRSDLEKGIDLVALLAGCGIAKGKGDAARRISAGGIYINNLRADEGTLLGMEHCASEHFIVLRSGKKNYHLIEIVRPG